MADSAAEYLEIRWRVKDSDEAWSAPHRVSVYGDIAVKNLDQSKTYEFEARAVSSCGAKSVWVPSDYVVPTVPAPQGTPSLTAQSVADGVHLGWTIPLAQTGIWWIIERGTSATGPWTQRAKLQSTSYTDPETSGSTYYYRVHAQNWFDGAGPYSNVVSSQGVSVDKLGDDVAAAAAAAQAAQDAADTANNALADIVSDNVLSSPEKPVVMRDYSVITTEQAGIDAQAEAYSITTEKTAYESAVSALTTYLGSLPTTPTAWDDKTGNTPIVGATFRGKFNAVYAARQTLLNAIYAAAKQAATDAEASAKAYTDSELTAYVEATVYDSKIAAMQSQIDGAINSYFYDYDATTTNAPANGWTTTAEKDAHLGDTFTNGWDGSSAGGSGTPGASWRWALSGSTYYWQVISDTSTQKALALAAAAQDTADHKRRNFTAQPTTPYDVGDTWTQNGVVYACTTAKTASGNFAQSDWTKAGDITSQNQSASTAAIGNHTQDDLPSGINYGRVSLPYLDGTGRITNFYDRRAARIRQFDSLAGKQTASFTGGDVSDIPTPISDGRVGMAIDLSGKIKTGWYTSRKIAGINFDGTADIAIPRGNLTGTIDNVPDGTNYRRAGAGYVDASGRLTAVWDGTTIRQGADIGSAVGRANTGLDANGYLRTRFATPRKIAGINFDGTADIDVPLSGLTGRNTSVLSDDANLGGTATWSGVTGTGKPADNATVGADWASNLANRPQNIGPNLADHATFFDGTGRWINEKNNADGIAANVGSTDGYLQCNVTAGNVNAGNQNFYEDVWHPTQPGVIFYIAVDLSAYQSIHDVEFGLNFADDSHGSLQWLPCGVTAAGIGATHRFALITTPAGATQVRLWAAVIGGAIGDAVRFGHVQWAREALMTPGSHARLGDLRNQVAVGYANFGSGWSGGNISYTASSDGTATINVSSATLQAGSIALTYSASSVSVSGGVAGGISVYYLYYDDPDSSGGAKTLHATTSKITSLASDGRRLVGQIKVTFPSSGSGSGGGGLGCITPDAYVMIHRARETRIITAGELQKTYHTGDYIRAVDPATGLEWWQQIDSVQLGVANGVTVKTTNGCQLTCTDIAWLGQPDGSRIRAKDTQGQSLYTRAGASEASMTSAGTIDIVKIMSGGVFFLASSDGQNWLAHHNMKPAG